MLDMTLKGKSVDFDVNFPIEEQNINFFNQGAIVIIKNRKQIAYEIFTLDEENKFYNHTHFAIDSSKQFYDTYEILTNGHLLIFYESFTKIGVFDIISQSTRIIDSGLKPQGIHRYYKNDIYEVENGQLRVLDFSLFPKISEFVLFENIHYIKDMDELGSKSILPIQFKSHPKLSYFTLPVRPQQQQLYFEVSSKNFMFINQGKGMGKTIFAKMDFQKIQFEQGRQYQYKAFNSFQVKFQLNNKIHLSVGPSQRCSIFQLMPKQKILRVLKTMYVFKNIQLINQKQLLGYDYEEDLFAIFVQDITTAMITHIKSSAFQIINDNLLLEINERKMSVFELKTETVG